ncbi:MAG TPA: hypothetical protein VNU68_34040 [Verrucomicrobiae bacterium]|nr:hypothetical protein [Verrucomicrobiae bacterium]
MNKMTLRSWMAGGNTRARAGVMARATLARFFTVCLPMGLLLSLSLPLGWSVRAAEEELQPPRPRPNIQELRERFRSLSPEERQKLFREFREKRPAGTNRSEWESFREELRKLPPEQREERIQEFRRRLEEVPPQFRILTPEERETKRKQMKERVASQISQLRAKKAEGSLTDVEERRLHRMEEMATRLEQGTVLGPRRAAPFAGLPPPRRLDNPSGDTNHKASPSTPPDPAAPGQLRPGASTNEPAALSPAAPRTPPATR